MRKLKIDIGNWKLEIGNLERLSSFKFQISFCATLLFYSVTHAQTISLDSILHAVKDRNPMLKSYSARAEAMHAYAKGAKGWMAPEVGGGLWMVPYKKVDDPRDQGQIMLSIQQKITNPAKLKANQGYLESKAAVENASEKYVYNELRAQVRMTYYQWMVLEKKRIVLKENEEIMSLVLKIAQLRYPYNQSKLSNVYKAEGRLEEVRNMIFMNDNEIVQKNILLDRLMNVPTDFRFSIDTSGNVIQFHPEVIDTTTLAERRSDVKRIDQSIRSLRLNQQMENNQSKPDFSLSFSHMMARSSEMPNQFMLLGMVSIPIAPWSSRMYKSNIAGMDREVEAMKDERAALLTELQGMTTGMESEILTLGKQIENYQKRIVPALRKNYETIMLAYEENKEDLPQVIDGWEALNMTQLQYLDTVQRYYETVVQYEKQIEK